MKINFSGISTMTLLICIHASTLHADINSILEQCADCHGKSGNSDKDSMPTIAGMSQTYFADTMLAFKQGDRPASSVTRKGKTDTDMQSIARELDEGQIKQLAKYFSEQSFIARPQPYDTDMALAGKRLHKKYCDKCHEKGGSSSEDDAGILAGQQKIYLKKSLEEIIEGKRSVSKKMKKRMDTLQQEYGREGFEQLIQYYISQGNKQ